jgi:hypothetical protein
MPRCVEKYFLNASLEMNNDRRLIEDYPHPDRLPALCVSRCSEACRHIILHHGSANTINAVPRGAPYISGAYPSTQPPHPTGTPMYCLPFTL